MVYGQQNKFIKEVVQGFGKMMSGQYDNLRKNADRWYAIADAWTEASKGKPLGDCAWAKIINAGGGILLDLIGDVGIGYSENKGTTEILEGFLGIDKLRKAAQGEPPQWGQGFEPIMK
jgi:hypothetical protein